MYIPHPSIYCVADTYLNSPVRSPIVSMKLYWGKVSLYDRLPEADVMMRQGLESGTCPIRIFRDVRGLCLPQHRTLSTRHPLVTCRLWSKGCWVTADKVNFENTGAALPGFEPGTVSAAGWEHKHYTFQLQSQYLFIHTNAKRSNPWVSDQLVHFLHVMGIKLTLLWMRFKLRIHWTTGTHRNKEKPFTLTVETCTC